MVNASRHETNDAPLCILYTVCMYVHRMYDVEHDDVVVDGADGDAGDDDDDDGVRV